MMIGNLLNINKIFTLIFLFISNINLFLTFCRLNFGPKFALLSEPWSNQGGFAGRRRFCLESRNEIESDVKLWGCRVQPRDLRALKFLLGISFGFFLVASEMEFEKQQIKALKKQVEFKDK